MLRPKLSVVLLLIVAVCCSGCLSKNGLAVLGLGVKLLATVATAAASSGGHSSSSSESSEPQEPLCVQKRREWVREHQGSTEMPEHLQCTPNGGWRNEWAEPETSASAP